ncbi:tripartite tricarboxylate transporter TctB family protein [Caproiciproducens sp. NJN-50]|uniref:tripartite tricarboxylate transporter TctB family protein n=2 Tax=Acutalibacteraceae TaxID=3082771 RepID=UPI000FFE2861|nr:tripartite tricarboxylate transporter TctB family protein [Caproiciproducens sp. NJN-50]QAT48757.1 tripartite tricarboxylate transporter TctB family protein [Caproiciproducens sp. NJN-50]
MFININILAGLASMLFGLVYMVLTLQIPHATIGNAFAPAIFPMMVGAALFVSGIVLMTSELKKERSGGQTAEKIELKFHGFRTMRFENRMILITVLAALLYALVFNTLGYVLSTIIFLGILLFTLNGRKKWKTNLLVTLVFSVAVYVIFTQFLYIPLPAMPFVDL